MAALPQYNGTQLVVIGFIAVEAFLDFDHINGGEDGNTEVFVSALLSSATA